MKTVDFDTVDKNDELLLLVYSNGDNPILCRKEDFDVNIASQDSIVFEITVNKVSTVKKTYSLVEKK